MPDILHRVGVDAPLERVLEPLISIEGVRAWWDDKADGSTAPGGEFTFRGARMRVLEAGPGRVRWLCVGGPAEWLDTEVTFDLAWRDGQTFVLFTHAGWRSPVEFMRHCSTKWAVFLLSLKALVETGEGRPTPADTRIMVGG